MKEFLNLSGNTEEVRWYEGDVCRLFVWDDVWTVGTKAKSLQEQENDMTK